MVRASPVRETVCGLFFTLSLTESVPSRVPVVVGVKVTLIVQVPSDARLPIQLFVSAKLAVAETLPMLSAAVP